jgi:hypothetical protein
VSAILDTYGFGAAMLALVTGTNTDTNATFAVLLEESSDAGMSGAAAVDDKDMIGTEALAGFQFDDDVECRKLGYIGSSSPRFRSRESPGPARSGHQRSHLANISGSGWRLHAVIARNARSISSCITHRLPDEIGHGSL